MMAGYQGHGDVNNPEAFAAPASWERAMSSSRYNGINLDIGHFIAGDNTSPIPFIRQYADRITHIHYPVPEGSDVMKEIARCVHFRRDALA